MNMSLSMSDFRNAFAISQVVTIKPWTAAIFNRVISDCCMRVGAYVVAGSLSIVEPLATNLAFNVPSLFSFRNKLLYKTP